MSSSITLISGPFNQAKCILTKHWLGTDKANRSPVVCPTLVGYVNSSSKSCFKGHQSTQGFFRAMGNQPVLSNFGFYLSF